MVEILRSDFATTINYLLRSTVFLYSEKDKISGTGFFSGTNHNGRQYSFLISAKHIFENRKEISLRIVREIDSGRKILMGEFCLKLLSEEGNPLWFTAWDLRKEIDVAILPVDDLVQKIKVFDEKKGVKEDLFFFDLSTFADKSLIIQEGISVGADVLFPGYPLGLVSGISYPILRSGIIATPPGKDFDLLSKTKGRYEPIFLVDGQFFPGSSGSPVFWPINPTRFNVEENKAEHREGLKINSPFLFLGVGTAFFPYPGSVTGAPLGTFYKENSGLGQVYRAQIIKSLIMEYVLEKAKEQKDKESKD